MKKAGSLFVKCIVFAFVVFMVLSDAFATETIQTSVTEVTIYRQGAQVKRTAEIAITEGKKEYTIYGLSPYLKEDTLQLKIEPPEITVLQSRVFDTYLKQVEQKKKEALLKEIKEIERDIALKEAQIRAIDATLELARKKDTCGMSLRQCLTETGPLVEELFKRQAILVSEVKALKEKKDRLEKELQGLGSSEKTKALSLLLDCPEGIEKAQVSIVYFVERAKWWPYYVVSVDTEQAKATLRYLAEIEQTTGEDWQNTSVVLSTSMPFFWGILPEPEPWRIDLYKPSPPPRVLYKAMPLMEVQRKP
ncbi:MAG: mucoidy inhibitor MuiA family protein, partial [Nitrospirae bacterium]